MIDQIGDWSTAGVGQAYGEGYSLEVSIRILFQQHWRLKNLKCCLLAAHHLLSLA